MEHGILSTAGNYIMEATEPESIPHYAAKVLCAGDGNERRTPEEAEQLADRIVLATNAYDALVAQRDALVGALEELVDLVEAARQGEYEIGYYTTQPGRHALAALTEGNDAPR